MAKNNYLIEGVSGTGKSSVCAALRARGYKAIDGDQELAYQGDPVSGKKTTGFTHENHIWDVEKVNKLAKDKNEEVAFFCGGSRNFRKFIDLFDKVFILDVDSKTLDKRLDSRPINAWGKSQQQRQLIHRLHKTKEDIPSGGITIDATRSLDQVVDQIIQNLK